MSTKTASQNWKQKVRNIDPQVSGASPLWYLLAHKATSPVQVYCDAYRSTILPFWFVYCDHNIELQVCLSCKETCSCSCYSIKRYLCRPACPLNKNYHDTSWSKVAYINFRCHSRWHFSLKKIIFLFPAQISLHDVSAWKLRPSSGRSNYKAPCI